MLDAMQRGKLARREVMQAELEAILAVLEDPHEVVVEAVVAASRDDAVAGAVAGELGEEWGREQGRGGAGIETLPDNGVFSFLNKILCVCIRTHSHTHTHAHTHP